MKHAETVHKNTKEIEAGDPAVRHHAIQSVLELRRGQNTPIATVLAEAAEIERYVTTGKTKPDVPPTV